MSFVWVCLAGDPPPVAKVWGQLADELLPYRLQDMVPLGPITEESWPVDWKIAMDNYLESYHVPIGHPGLYRMFTPDYEDQKAVPGVARGLSWMRDKDSPRWSEGLYQRLIGRAATHLPARPAPLLAFLQRAAEFGYRCVSGSNGLFPGAARWPRPLHHSWRGVWTAR